MTLVDLDFKTRQEIAGELEDEWSKIDDAMDAGPPPIPSSQQKPPLPPTTTSTSTITPQSRVVSSKDKSRGASSSLQRPGGERGGILSKVPKTKSFITRPVVDDSKRSSRSTTRAQTFKGRSKEAIIEAGLQLSGTYRRRRSTPKGVSVDDLSASLGSPSGSRNRMVVVDKRAPSAPPAGRHQVNRSFYLFFQIDVEDGDGGWDH